MLRPRPTAIGAQARGTRLVHERILLRSGILGSVAHDVEHPNGSVGEPGRA